jgi:hypothetical protein
LKELALIKEMLRQMDNKISCVPAEPGQVCVAERREHKGDEIGGPVTPSRDTALKSPFLPWRLRDQLDRQVERQIVRTSGQLEGRALYEIAGSDNHIVEPTTPKARYGSESFAVHSNDPQHPNSAAQHFSGAERSENEHLSLIPPIETLPSIVMVNSSVSPEVRHI